MTVRSQLLEEQVKALTPITPQVDEALAAKIKEKESTIKALKEESAKVVA